MREILFRGKRKNNGQWVYGSYVYASKLKAPDGTVTKEIHTIVPAVFDENTPPDDVFVDPETIGQYTGLEDKNGVKIFEGDVIHITSDQHPKYTMLVVYSRFHVIDFAQTLDEVIEVIGNIHDNPELLEVKE